MMNNLFEEIGVKKEEEKSKGSVDEVNKSINRELEVESYTLYRRRWLILISFGGMIMNLSMVTNSFAPISPSVARAYGVPGWTVDL